MKKRKPKSNFGPFLGNIENKLFRLSKSDALKISIEDVEKEFFSRQVNAVRQLLLRRNVGKIFHLRSNYFKQKMSGEITIVYMEFYQIHGLPMPTQGKQRRSKT